MAQIHKKFTLYVYDTNVVKKWHSEAKMCTRRKFGHFSADFGILCFLWHNCWKNHTLSGAWHGKHLVFKTLPLAEAPNDSSLR